MRHLGIIRSKLAENNTMTKVILLTEMTARALKAKFRIECHKLVQKMKQPEDTPLRKLALSFLHSIVSESPSFLNWTNCTEVDLGERDIPDLFNVKDIILKKFGLNSLNEKEKKKSDLKKLISRRLLLLRLQETTELKLTRESIEEFSQFPGDFVFTDSDLLSFEPKVFFFCNFSFLFASLLNFFFLEGQIDESFGRS